MAEFLEILNQYLKPELLILIPVIYVINTILFKTKVNNDHIPYITGIFSIVLCTIYVFATSQIVNINSILMAIFTSLTQGILIGGTGLYSNIILNILPTKFKEAAKKLTNDSTDITIPFEEIKKEIQKEIEENNNNNNNITN